MEKTSKTILPEDLRYRKEDDTPVMLGGRDVSDWLLDHTLAIEAAEQYGEERDKENAALKKENENLKSDYEEMNVLYPKLLKENEELKELCKTAYYTGYNHYTHDLHYNIHNGIGSGWESFKLKNKLLKGE